MWSPPSSIWWKPQRPHVPPLPEPEILARGTVPRANAFLAPQGGDHMFLHGIEAFGRQGVFDFERRNGQRYIIDLEWWIDTQEARSSDRLDATVCYQQLVDAMQAVVGGQAWHLIETLCQQLTISLQAQFPRITTI